MWAYNRGINNCPKKEKKDMDFCKYKDSLFNDLIHECKHSAPGAHLNPKLRMSLGKLVAHSRKDIASRVKDGCAPLFIACKRGNVDIVEYLITECHVDIEQRGLYEVPDDRSVHFVTPLWCAAVSGKLDVIKCLVKHGADINAGSDSGSTPVRSACFMTHLDIVKFLVQNGANVSQANYNGGTCLINSVQSAQLCTFLLDNGADVNAADIQNKTALHYAIQEHRVETTKLFLDHGADPFAVSKLGDDALQTACLKGATQIFTLLCQRVDYSDERLADAHELIGSTLLDDFNDTVSCMTHWRTANSIRHNASPYIEKKPKLSPRACYFYTTEFTDEDDLDAIATDIDEMRMQSLLICERVLGVTHKDTVFRLTFRGASYAEALRYQRCIDLWIWALQIRIERDTILFSDTCHAAQALVKILLDLITGHVDVPQGLYPVSRYVPKFQDIVLLFNMLIENIKEMRALLDIKPFYKKQSEMFDRMLKCITHIIYLLVRVAKTPSERAKTKELVTNLIKLNIRSAYTDDTLLHLSVSRLNIIRSTYFAEDSEVRNIFPNLSVVKILLDCGANVNAKNESKSTALHVAAIPYNFSLELIHLLLSYNAHVDQPNKFGDSPARLITMNPFNNVRLLKHVSLKCLAANVVVANHLPYENGQIPTTLVDFVKFHEP